MSTVKVIKVNENVFAANDREADDIREMCKRNKTFFVNVMSAPGSGKTTMLVSLINMLKDKYNILEMDVDIDTDLDARRVAEETGIPSVQIPMILSVPEGDDKPLKYPLMFTISDLVIISKIDTVDFFEFDFAAARERILALNPKAEIIEISAKTGEGMDKLAGWFVKQIEDIRE